MIRSITKWMLALIATSAFAIGAAEPEKVSIPQAGRSDSPEPVVGFLFRPKVEAKAESKAENKGAAKEAGKTEVLRPAVIMLHGCGGAYAKEGGLNARHKMWGEYFAEHGYVALMLDSFTSRGIREICTVKFANRTLKESQRVGDAYAALEWLRAQPGVDAGRVVLLGWSHGGGVTLDTITKAPEKMAGFRAAVSFYPGCTTRAKKSADFHPYAPLLLLIGEADDWTPAAPCKVLAAAAEARHEPMQIVTYPDTYHDFDNPALTKARVRADVPNGVRAGGGATTAPNPAAREDAKRRVLAFFAESDKPAAK